MSRSESSWRAMDETELLEAVRSIAVVFDRRKVRHALIGGLAVGVRSRPRSTKDADFLIQVPALAFPGLLEDLIAEGFEIELLEAIRQWSAARLLVFYRRRIRIDWLQPDLPIYVHVLDTADRQPWRDTGLNVATSEGLILTKMVAFRPQDQADIVTLLAANRNVIDVSMIRGNGRPMPAQKRSAPHGLKLPSPASYQPHLHRRPNRNPNSASTVPSIMATWVSRIGSTVRMPSWWPKTVMPAPSKARAAERWPR